jgi:ribonuclease-3
MDLGRFVLLGRGEEKTGGRQKHAILADSFEAVIAAIYLDGGIEAARDFILSRFEPLVRAAGDRAAEASFTEDWKSALQEQMQAAGPRPAALSPRRRRGPRTPKAIRNRSARRRTADRTRHRRSKKEAEQQAAKAALGESTST